MREHHLKKANVLGVNVCDLRPEKGVALSLDAMRSHELHTVFFLSALSSIYCQENPWAMDLINSCDLVFPGDRHTEMAVQQKTPLGENGLGRFTEEYMKRFFTRMNREYRELFLVTMTQERLDALSVYLKKMYPDISVGGMVYEKDTEDAADKLVNEINGHIPDAVLILLPPEIQLALLRDYESMMNAGLCLCIESLQPMVVKEIRPVPEWVRRFHLVSFYQWLHKEEKLQSRIAGSIFRKKITEESQADTEGQEGQDAAGGAGWESEHDKQKEE